MLHFDYVDLESGCRTAPLRPNPLSHRSQGVPKGQPALDGPGRLSPEQLTRWVERWANSAIKENNPSEAGVACRAAQSDHGFCNAQVLAYFSRIIARVPRHATPSAPCEEEVNGS